MNIVSASARIVGFFPSGSPRIASSSWCCCASTRCSRAVASLKCKNRRICLRNSASSRYWPVDKSAACSINISYHDMFGRKSAISSKKIIRKDLPDLPRLFQPRCALHRELHVAELTAERGRTHRQPGEPFRPHRHIPTPRTSRPANLRFRLGDAWGKGRINHDPLIGSYSVRLDGKKEEICEGNYANYSGTPVISTQSPRRMLRGLRGVTRRAAARHRTSSAISVAMPEAASRTFEVDLCS